MRQQVVQNSQQPPSGNPRIAGEISLVRGGPFYRAQELTRLLTRERWNLGRRIALAMVLGWLPLLAITLLSKPNTVVDLLTDYAVNVRMLIAVPALLAGQILMERTFMTIVRYIRKAELLSPSEQAKMDLAIAGLVRLRDSVVAEVIIVLLVYLHSATMAGSRM